MNIKNATIPFLIAVAMLNSGIAYSRGEKSCLVKTCYAGDMVMTYAAKGDPFYLCSTKELSEYTGTVLGFVALTISFTGHMPNISDKTGEPEYEGQTKAMIESMRAKAGVNSFDEALAHCSQGRNRTKMMILNFPKDSMSMYVADARHKRTCWMLKGFADHTK